MPWSDIKRRVVQSTLVATGQAQSQQDDDLQDKKDRYSKMARDLNVLGAGMYETLGTTKTCFKTSTDASEVFDKFYNGSYNDIWPEVDSGASMRLHGSVAAYKQVWTHAHNKTRPAAASLAVERALAQVRYFVNNTVSEVRSKVAERNAAKLDFDAYKRRYETKAKKGDGANSSLPSLRQKLEISEARYNTLNTQLKDLIVKTKLARDGLIEDAAITFIVCQEQMYKDLASSLSDVVSQLPQDKVLSIQKRISDSVLTGNYSGSASQAEEASAFSRAVNVATGVKTTADYTKSEAQLAAELASQQAATQRAIAVAESEQGILSRTASHAPPMHQPAHSPTPPPPPPPPAAAAATSPGAAPSGGEQFKVLYDCEAESPEDLALKAGQIVTVLAKDESGWWQGTCNGKTGQFPANYVTTIPVVTL